MKVDVIINHWSKEYNIIRNVYFPDVPVIDFVVNNENFIQESVKYNNFCVVDAKEGRK